MLSQPSVSKSLLGRCCAQGNERNLIAQGRLASFACRTPSDHHPCPLGFSQSESSVLFKAHSAHLTFTFLSVIVNSTSCRTFSSFHSCSSL